MCTGQKAHVSFIVLWGGHTSGPGPQGPMGKQLSYIKHVTTTIPCTGDKTNSEKLQTNSEKLHVQGSRGGPRTETQVSGVL